MRLLIDFARTGEGEGRDEVQDEFRRRAGLEAGGASEYFGAGVRQDRAVEEGMVAISRIAGDEDGFGSATSGFGEAAPDERRMPAGRDADDDVLGGHRAGSDGADARGFIVLRAFDGTPESATSTGDDALDERGGRAEGWRAFAGVEHAKAAARAGAAINQTAPGGEGTWRRLRPSIRDGRFPRGPCLGAWHPPRASA